MNPEAVEILDQSLWYSLWAFLISLLAFLSFVAFRLRQHRRRIEELWRRDFQERSSQIRQKKTGRAASFKPDEWPMALHATLAAFFVASVVFLVLTFSPVSFIDNFVRSEAWRVTPLRLTALTYERFYEGFSLEGEVWNQTSEPLDEVYARVRVWAPDRELLEELTFPVSPSPVPAGSAASFRMSYTENSPFLYGYEVAFIDSEGREIPHTEGFDVR